MGGRRRPGGDRAAGGTGELLQSGRELSVEFPTDGQWCRGGWRLLGVQGHRGAEPREPMWPWAGDRLNLSPFLLAGSPSFSQSFVDAEGAGPGTTCRDAERDQATGPGPQVAGSCLVEGMYQRTPCSSHSICHGVRQFCLLRWSLCPLSQSPPLPSAQRGRCEDDCPGGSGPRP